MAAYRLLWWQLLALALAAIAVSWFAATSGTLVLALRLLKSLVLISVSAILFRRRGRDPVAAMLALAFLLWTASSSIDISSSALLPSVLDRIRFLLFSLALLLFPDGKGQPKWTPVIALAIGATYLIGLAEAIGLLATELYLPIAIVCVIASLAALSAKYRAIEDGTEKQQLKWVTLGLFVGISLILTARAAAALTIGMAMPLIGSIAIEGLFQAGIVVLALGFLISLLRYRLYDAEAVISRSAIYAALTLSLVGTFAACEALIELLGQRYFGSSIGGISGTVAAAIVATLLAPLHSRISGWAEKRFHHDLAVLRRDLPDLLLNLSSGSSLKQLAESVLPRIEQAVQATRMALLVDARMVAAQGIERGSARRLLKGWQAPDAPEQIDRKDDDAFPLRMPLRCPFGTVRGWLLLGPRPDGSFYGKDDLAALEEIARPLQRSVFAVAAQEAQQRKSQRQIRELADALQSMALELGRLRRRAA